METWQQEAARARRRRRALEAVGVPDSLAFMLARAGYAALADVARASDGDLLHRVYMLGPKRLRLLRAWLSAHPLPPPPPLPAWVQEE